MAPVAMHYEKEKSLSHSKRLKFLLALTARVNNIPWGSLKSAILLYTLPVCLTHL